MRRPFCPFRKLPDRGMLHAELFKPDFLTAFGMIALSAFCMVWVMSSLGRAYWRQGIAEAVWSAALCGVAYAIFAVQAKLGMVELQVLAKTLISVAISAFTVALQRFRHSYAAVRDVSTVVLPVVASLALAWWYLPGDLIAFNRMQTVVTVVQTVCTLQVLVAMRASAPGIGWLLVTAAIVGQLVSIIPLVFVKDRPMPAPGAEMPLSALLTMWALCLTLFLKLMVTSIGFLVMLRDRQVAQDFQQASLDPLTQLPNRSELVRGMTEAMQAAIGAAHPLTVLVIDIDHFKRVNDQHGHLAGDLVIQMVARALKQQSRSKDLVARYGGEEFVLVLPETQQKEAHIVAERVCAVIRNTPVELRSGEQLQVTVSIGVHATCPVPEADWKQLIEEADAAMYQAKRRGRDRVAISPSSTPIAGVLAS